MSGSSSGNRAGGFSGVLACTWSGGCIYSSVSLSCVDTGTDQWHFSVARAKDLFSHLSLFLSLCDNSFTLTSCKIIELMSTHVLSSLLSIHDMDITPHISLLNDAVILMNKYTLHVHVQLLALGSVRTVSGHIRPETRQKYYWKNLSHPIASFLLGVLSYCDRSTTWRACDTSSEHGSCLSSPHHRVMLPPLTNTCSWWIFTNIIIIS